ncbi:MAG TPA: F0F1 ATP synthase subunit delta, partial [Novosphingobium sp.]|nr:F0F1 ATP synthase subunit delta [Novosphingobium sp.]
NRLLDEAAAARTDAEAARAQAEAARKAADAAREAALAAARAEVAQQREALLEQAQAQAQALRTEAEAAIARARTAEQAQLAEQAHRLAVEIAARLLAGPAGQLPVAAFLADLEQALAGLPPASRASLARPEAPLQLASAQPLAEAEKAAVAAALARVLGAAVPLAYASDPALIAGLRLTGPLAVAEASLRADLQRVAERLNRHDG